MTFTGTPSAATSSSSPAAAAATARPTSQASGKAKSAPALSPAPVVGGVQPCVTFVNVELCGDLAAGEGRTGSQATVLLENPAGQNALSGDHLVGQVGVRVVLSENPADQNALSGDHLVDQVGVWWCCNALSWDHLVDQVGVRWYWWKIWPARMLCRGIT